MAVKPKNDCMIEVHFSTLSLQKTTAKLSVDIPRDSFNIVDAEHILSDTELQVLIAVDPNAENDDPKQKKLVDTTISLDLIAQSKNLTVKNDVYSIGLTFKWSSIEKQLMQLCQFRYRGGTMKAKRIGSASSESEQSEAA